MIAIFIHAIGVLLLGLASSLVNAESTTLDSAVPSPVISAVSGATPTVPVTLTSAAPEGICTLGTVPGSLHQPSCVINCLVDPQNFGSVNGTACTDSLTNDCVCLAGPAAAIEAVATCVVSSCASAAMANATDAADLASVSDVLSSDLAVATSLYSSYCLSVFGPTVISVAISSEQSGPTPTPAPNETPGTASGGTATAQTVTSPTASVSLTTTTSAGVTPATSNVAAVLGNGPFNR